jgi:hypothetical protein
LLLVLMAYDATFYLAGQSPALHTFLLADFFITK